MRQVNLHLNIELDLTFQTEGTACVNVQRLSCRSNKIYPRNEKKTIEVAMQI